MNMICVRDCVWYALGNSLSISLTVSAGDDHIHDQHEYPKDYAHDYEDFDNNVELLYCFLQYGVTCTCKDDDPLEHIQDHIYDNSEYHFSDCSNCSNHNPEQSHVTHDYVSPGGSSYWIPVVSDHIKPKSIQFFYSYRALMSGLDQLEQPNPTLSHNDICYAIRKVNQETAKVDTLDPQHNKIQRRKDSFMCECKAKIYMVLINILLLNLLNNIIISCLVRTICFLSRTKRKLDYSQEIFIHNLSKQNIGASRAHRLYTRLEDGSDIRGGLYEKSQFLHRFQGCKIPCSKDAGKEKNIPSFSFDFKVVEKKLNSIFWADETTKYNYNAFGDVSLDATFSMNTYDMVFVPFTGIDNHKKRVTFGVGLLSREDGSSYSWLLRAFLKAFKKQPMLVITYQDPALNKAVNERFHSIIWNSKLEPHDFEKEWKSCLNEYNISNNKWMQEMYGLRRRWVPAFFKDILMSGLMRTTSLSGGQNWSFQNNTLTGSYLLMFMMTFEGVMERKRRNQVVNDFNTATTLPRFITSSPIEPHASKVQKEISDSDNTCFQMSVTSNNGVDTIIVLEKQKNITTRQP
uniref:MULE transposase domain-containing protein n=1 Tax=Lactuca sativa TaxID=4236 RepID=A0A9R1UY15_LACSA|nr:hypothetical protein LSAT_V11C700380670 [Lactuca sativa]